MELQAKGDCYILRHKPGLAILIHDADVEVDASDVASDVASGVEDGVYYYI
ncbi:MAG: hypothetical protein U5L98_12840 [Halomonas sp.]|nr:hypothetical protein [Halomonas sp.]MDZ7853493.1 hypothetical protein [Halomonas sp.]